MATKEAGSLGISGHEGPPLVADHTRAALYWRTRADGGIEYAADASFLGAWAAHIRRSPIRGSASVSIAG